MRDDFRDHRVELRGDLVALGDSSVDAKTWTRRQPKPLDDAWRRREVVGRILRIESYLDGVPPLARGISLEPASLRDVNL